MILNLMVLSIVLEKRYHGGGVPIEPVVNITRTIDLTKTGDHHQWTQRTRLLLYSDF